MRTAGPWCVHSCMYDRDRLFLYYSMANSHSACISHVSSGCQALAPVLGAQTQVPKLKNSEASGKARPVSIHNVTLKSIHKECRCIQKKKKNTLSQAGIWHNLRWCLEHHSPHRGTWVQFLHPLPICFLLMCTGHGSSPWAPATNEIHFAFLASGLGLAQLFLAGIWGVIQGMENSWTLHDLC